VKVFGDDLSILERKAREVRDVIEKVPGAADVSVDVSAGAMQVQIDLDRGALARYGLNVADVRDAVQAGIGGVEASEVIEGRKRFPIVVRLAEAYRGTPEAIGGLLLNTPAGGRITLSQVANVRGRDLGGFAKDVKREVTKRVSLPDGYFVTYGGQFENQERAMARLKLIVPLVLLLIAGFLYASFGNARQAVLVMLNVPFALVGRIAALWLRDLHLNLSAAVGFIALFGVAVLNGVVLVSYINRLRSDGRSLDDAVREGAEVQLRPVLMTALVASVGFIPMAISTSPGSEVQRPLATVVIAGLVTSTLLTLVVLPIIYEWVERRWAVLAEKSRRRAALPEDMEPETT